MCSSRWQTGRKPGAAVSDEQFDDRLEVAAEVLFVVDQCLAQQHPVRLHIPGPRLAQRQFDQLQPKTAGSAAEFHFPVLYEPTNKLVLAAGLPLLDEDVVFADPLPGPGDGRAEVGLQQLLQCRAVIKGRERWRR